MTRLASIFEFQERVARQLVGGNRAEFKYSLGMGRMRTITEALDLLQDQKGPGTKLRGIIVCQSDARYNWEHEIKENSRYERTYFVGGSPHDSSYFERWVFDVMILSFDVAAKRSLEILNSSEKPDFVIVDAAHTLKSRSSKRAIALFGEDGCGGLFNAAEWAVLMKEVAPPAEKLGFFQGAI